MKYYKVYLTQQEKIHTRPKCVGFFKSSKKAKLYINEFSLHTNVKIFVTYNSLTIDDMEDLISTYNSKFRDFTDCLEKIEKFRNKIDRIENERGF